MPSDVAAADGLTCSTVSLEPLRQLAEFQRNLTFKLAHELRPELLGLNHFEKMMGWHSGHGGPYDECLHQPLADRTWLVVGTPAYNKLRSIISNARLVKDIKHLSYGYQTYSVESFGSVLIEFASKSRAFKPEGMKALVVVYQDDSPWSPEFSKRQNGAPGFAPSLHHHYTPPRAVPRMPRGQPTSSHVPRFTARTGRSQGRDPPEETVQSRQDTRLREAGVEAVYCLARGAPKGPNIPRAQLNHQGPLFPGHGYATHSQTWVGEPTWLGVRSDATHQAPTKVGAPCVRVWWPTWLGSVVTLLTKHLAPKVQAPPAGLGVRGDATLQTPAFTGAPCGVWRKEKEILTLRAKENISYPEAKQRLSFISRGSYSDAVRRGPALHTESRATQFSLEDLVGPPRAPKLTVGKPCAPANTGSTQASFAPRQSCRLNGRPVLVGLLHGMRSEAIAPTPWMQPTSLKSSMAHMLLPPRKTWETQLWVTLDPARRSRLRLGLVVERDSTSGPRKYAYKSKPPSDKPSSAPETIREATGHMFALGETFPVLFLARAIQGVGSSCITVAGLGAVASLYPDDSRRSKVMGFTLGGAALGVLAGYPYGGVLYDFVGKTTPFVVLASFSIVLSVLCALLALPTHEETPLLRQVSSLTLLMDPYVLIVTGTIGVSTSAIAILEPCLPIWLMDALAPSKWQLGELG
ncbi:synaptic vesicular amine transporter-like [Ixodes scapularis]